ERAVHAVVDADCGRSDWVQARQGPAGARDDPAPFSGLRLVDRLGKHAGSVAGDLGALAATAAAGGQQRRARRGSTANRKRPPARQTRIDWSAPVAVSAHDIAPYKSR